MTISIIVVVAIIAVFLAYRSGYHNGHHDGIDYASEMMYPRKDRS
jgi:hypothetical protein